MSNAAAFDEQAGMLMEGCQYGDPQLEASIRDRLRARCGIRPAVGVSVRVEFRVAPLSRSLVFPPEPPVSPPGPFTEAGDPAPANRSPALSWR